MNYEKPMMQVMEFEDNVITLWLGASDDTIQYPNARSGGTESF